jgi:hypothetical protein
LPNENERTHVCCYGFDSRKNRFPAGDVMVMLFVPLLVVMV